MTKIANVVTHSSDESNLNTSFFRNAGLALSLLAGGLIGCDSKNENYYNIDMTTHNTELKSITAESEQVQIERVGIFKDDLAYRGERGVYRIKDPETGKEFIGISGIGISEVGSHSSGKTTVTDER